MKKKEYIKRIADKILLEEVKENLAKCDLTISDVTPEELIDMINEVALRKNPKMHILDGYFGVGGLSEIIARKKTGCKIAD